MYAGSYGLPGQFSHFHPKGPESAPRLSTYLFGSPDKHGVHLCSRGVVVPPAREDVCLGVVRGFREVERRKVGAAWLWREGGPFGKRESVGRAQEGERVIIYFVGGGYVFVLSITLFFLMEGCRLIEFFFYV